MVEQLTVNQLVLGSNPSRGAKKNSPWLKGYFLFTPEKPGLVFDSMSHNC